MLDQFDNPEFNKKLQEISNAEKMCLPMEEKHSVTKTPTIRKKRDIFRFQGEKDISINLEHVTSMFVEGNRITFQFYTTATFVDLEDDAAAKKAFEQILGIWSADVVE